MKKLPPKVWFFRRYQGFLHTLKKNPEIFLDFVFERGKPDPFITCNEVFSRAKHRGALPSIKSRNSEEQQDARWIQEQRRWKNYGRPDRNNLWNPIFENIAADSGFPNCFSSRADNSLQECHSVFARAKSRGRLPQITERDVQEKSDAYWINNRRINRLGPKQKTFIDRWITIAAEYGFPDAFSESLNDAERSTSSVIAMFDRAAKRGNLPRQKTGDDQQQKDYSVLRHLKDAKKGIGRRKWRKEFEEIACQYGFPNAFSIDILS